MSFLVESTAFITDMALFEQLLKKRGYVIYSGTGIKNGRKILHTITANESNRPSAWIVSNKGKKYLYADKDKSYSTFARNQILNGLTTMQEYTFEQLKRANKKLKIKNMSMENNNLLLRLEV